MSLRFHEIAETYHQILNPFTDDQLILLGQICRLQPGLRQLDLACGKGEMLCRWAAEFGSGGVGVDISTVFLTAARKRAATLGVSSLTRFVQADASQYQASRQAFDLVSCIGATWIGNGLAGTVELMKPALKPGGLLLIGEPFWHEPPPTAAYKAMGVQPDEFTSLAGTLDRFEAAELELVEMVIACLAGWDRYEAAQWQAVDDYLRQNPADPDAAQLRAWMAQNRRAYLAYGRRYFGWGVFVLRLRAGA